jgi:hypothetical protein
MILGSIWLAVALCLFWYWFDSRAVLYGCGDRILCILLCVLWPLVLLFLFLCWVEYRRQEYVRWGA